MLSTVLSTQRSDVRFRSLRKSVKHCGRCGGKHAGACNLVATSHGTHCRAEIVAAVERRFREMAAA